MKRIALLFSLMLLSACSDATVGNYDTPPRGRVSIAYLKSLVRGNSYLITDDVSIEGYVVANDLYGEYYKTIVVSDQSGGIEIGVDVARTAIRFPVSARVVVQCTGLAIGNYGGGLILGSAPEREYTVERIAEEDIERYMTIDRQNPVAVEPISLKIGEIAPEHVSCYVKISGVGFGDDAGKTWCDRDPESGDWLTTSRVAYDTQGNTLPIRTISTCEYRSERIPAGSGTLYGIVGYFNGEYSLRIVNHGIDFQK